MAVLSLGLLGYGLAAAHSRHGSALMVPTLRPSQVVGDCGAAQFRLRRERDAHRYASPTRLWPHDYATFAAR